MPTDVTDLTLPRKNAEIEEYFANLQTRDCAFEIWGRITAYYLEMRRTGRLALYRNSYTHFYMGWLYRATMYRTGEQGELTKTFWDHERNLLLHLKNQTTQNKLTYRSQVKNSNAKSSNLVDFANGLAKHFATDAKYGLDEKSVQGVEDTLVFGDSAIVGCWNRFLGEPVAQDPETGQMLKDGDMDYFCVTPMDHIINTAVQSREQIQWRIVRRWVNKYDLSANYPQMQDKIKLYNDSEETHSTKIVSLMHHDDETIPIFYFFHEKTAAVPQGRFLIMADPECVLEDGPLDYGEGQGGYDHVPVYDNVVSSMQGSPFGYTVAFDLIPLQQALNELVSAVTTNNINFATQCVMAPKGSNLEYQSLATGMSFIEYDPKMGDKGKPESLQLLSSSPETYKFIEMIIFNMETVAGVNAMVRGNPQEGVESGQYAALVAVQSVMFNSQLQRAYARQMESLIMGTIKTCRKNMIGKKVARIVGQTSEPYLKEFTSSDMTDIEDIQCDVANPMIQTPAGKMNVADTLMSTGIIKDVQQYLTVYKDGDLPQLTRRQDTQNNLIKQENEQISKGVCPEVAITDNHVAHILEHTQTFDTIEARLNPNSPSYIAGMQHTQKHINCLVGGIDPLTNQFVGQINPILASLLGMPSIPPGAPSPLQLPPMVPGMALGAPLPGNPGQNVPQRAKQPQSPQQMPSQPSQPPQMGMA